MAERKSSRPSARRMLAGELARLREESGRSLAELASLTTFDRSYLHKLERGEKLGSAQVMAALDAVYETGRHLQLLWQLGKEDAFRDKYRRFMELEQEATVRYEYVSNTVPGLLQTRAYAEDLLRAARPKDEHELEEQVAARLGRQEILTREDPPHYRALLDEAALRRTPVDSKIWQEQLEHLLEVADLPNVMLQIVPLSAGLHGLVGTSLTILWLADGSAVAYTESGYSGDLTEEPGEVERLKLSYDLLRDLALPPNASAQFIRTLLEETSCPDPS